MSARTKTSCAPKRKPRHWPKATLSELRGRRELAVGDGDLTLAFQLAIEIDKAKGY
jgi:hypothetical protein